MATLQKVAVTLRRDEARPRNTGTRSGVVDEIGWTMASYDWHRSHSKAARSGYISAERDGYFTKSSRHAPS